MKVFKVVPRQVRRRRGRTEWVPSEQAMEHERGPIEGHSGRGTCGEVLVLRTDERSPPPDPKPKRTTGCAVPVAAATWPRVGAQKRPGNGAYREPGATEGPEGHGAKERM